MKIIVVLVLIVFALFVASVFNAMFGELSVPPREVVTTEFLCQIPEDRVISYDIAFAGNQHGYQVVMKVQSDAQGISYLTGKAVDEGKIDVESNPEYSEFLKEKVDNCTRKLKWIKSEVPKWWDLPTKKQIHFYRVSGKNRYTSSFSHSLLIDPNNHIIYLVGGGI